MTDLITAWAVGVGSGVAIGMAMGIAIERHRRHRMLCRLIGSEGKASMGDL